MELFKTLRDILSKNSDVTIVIRKTGDDTLAVSTTLKNGNTEDPAAAVIAPFVVSGTAEELDAEYVPLIKAPMEKSAGIQDSMAAFEASAKAAQAASKAAGEAKRKAEDTKKTAKTAVTKLLSEADALAKQKKFGEAKSVYAKAKAEAEKNGLTAEKATAQKGIDACAKNDAPDMFAAFDGTEEPEPAPETGTKTDPNPEEEPEPEQEPDSDEQDPEDEDPDPDGDPDPLNFD